MTPSRALSPSFLAVEKTLSDNASSVGGLVKVGVWGC